VHVFKIDQIFIRKLEKSDGDSAIVRSIISLAKALNLQTIAEGVETMEQLVLLRQLGCDYAQGYLFSKPQPAAEITQLLVSRDCFPRGHGDVPAGLHEKIRLN
jgi:EAL domain-containing protein (putative c-di-GMP-specific phosphodiesterase class I)